MLYWVIESFSEGKLEQVGERFRTKGRMMPEGVEYQASWFTPDGSRCYQLMRAASKALLNEWMDQWKDLVEFEVIPVVTSQEFWASKSQDR